MASSGHVAFYPAFAQIVERGGGGRVLSSDVFGERKRRGYRIFNQLFEFILYDEEYNDFLTKRFGLE